MQVSWAEPTALQYVAHKILIDYPWGVEVRSAAEATASVVTIEREVRGAAVVSHGQGSPRTAVNLNWHPG
jgi:hypothetical protein